MSKTKFKQLLHPIRLRIIQTLITNKELTAQQISEKLGDIPPATLYRHLNALVELDSLKVVKETQVRGTVEKTYAFNTQSRNLTNEEFLKLSKEEHMELFFTYIMGILSDFETYLQTDYDFLKDSVSYRQAYLYLSRDELIDLSKKMGEIFMEYLNNEPKEGRELLSISTISIPKK